MNTLFRQKNEKDVQNWAKAIRKAKRYSGFQYTTSKNKDVAGKTEPGQVWF